ncbi:MAG: flagellar export chaperone FliS [Gammaproteobacteria bacterium]|nr:flagellar export chaperone FliS [Gammaproteobacteria bacterium]
MAYNVRPGGVSAYRQLGTQVEVESASQHRLIEMLLDGALSRIAMARGCLQRGDVPGKCQNISFAAAIVEGLDASLNREAGGELAGNLHELYLYLGERLLYANARNDGATLDEVQRLLTTIRDGWIGIRDRVPQTTAMAVR